MSEHARDRIEGLLADAFLDTEEMITRWVLVAEVIARRSLACGACGC